MNGSRKVEMLKRTQWLAFAYATAFMAIKGFADGGAPGLTAEVLLYGLLGVGVNFGAFVAGNVMGDHGKKEAQVQPQ
jgi:hypothetical protein